MYIRISYRFLSSFSQTDPDSPDCIETRGLCDSRFFILRHFRNSSSSSFKNYLLVQVIWCELKPIGSVLLAVVPDKGYLNLSQLTWLTRIFLYVTDSFADSLLQFVHLSDWARFSTRVGGIHIGETISYPGTYRLDCLQLVVPTYNNLVLLSALRAYSNEEGCCWYGSECLSTRILPASQLCRNLMGIIQAGRRRDCHNWIFFVSHRSAR